MMNIPRKDRIIFTEDIIQASLSETVYFCWKVTKGRILSAIREGARSLKGIKMATGAACTAGK
jgi:NAD(P)H-nitrite reductase large subunit